MERLTFDGNFCDIAQCRDQPCPYNGACSQRKVWERLKAYEDTGLEPTVCADYKTFEDEAISKGVPFKRIIELMDADKDGRVVVLPCKVGDTVYLIVTKRARTYTPEFKFIKKSRLTFLNMERILQDFGKTAFLTREEAEKALEVIEDG